MMPDTPPPAGSAPQPAPNAPTDVQTPAASPKPPASNVPADERLLSAAAYVPMLFIGALVMKPKSAFCQHHGKQGLLLSLLMFFTLFILVAIPAIGSLLFLAMIGVIAIGAFQAYSGLEWKAPLIYAVSSKLNVDKLFAGTVVKPVTTTSPAPTSESTQSPPPPSEPPSTPSPSKPS